MPVRNPKRPIGTLFAKYYPMPTLRMAEFARPGQQLRIARLNELEKDLLNKVGFVVHPCQDPEEAYLSDAVRLREFGLHRSLYAAIEEATGLKTLRELIDAGMFIDCGAKKAFSGIPGADSWLARVLDVPLRALTPEGRIGTHLGGILRLGVEERIGLGFALTRPPEVFWAVTTAGLPCYYAPTFEKAIEVALTAEPDARALLAYKPYKVRFCFAIGKPVARISYRGTDLAYGIFLNKR